MLWHCLQDVKCDGQGLTSICQDGLQQFIELRCLRLENNRLEDFSALQALPNLAQLFISCNRIAHLPIFSDSCFGKIRTLDVSFNFLSTEDLFGSASSLAQLPSLRELDASGNDLGQLPRALGSFPALQSLSLEFNSLDASCLRPLAALPRLEHLGLAHNCVASLPAQLLDSPEAFAKLTVLDLACNSIGCVSAVLLYVHVTRCRSCMHWLARPTCTLRGCATKCNLLSAAVHRVMVCTNAWCAATSPNTLL